MPQSSKVDFDLLCSTAEKMSIASNDVAVVHQQASSLIRAGTEVFLVGDVDDAQVFFDTSHELIMKISSGQQQVAMEVVPAAPQQQSTDTQMTSLPRIQAVSTTIGESTNTVNESSLSCPHPTSASLATWTDESPPDIYQSCDVCPRLLMSPVTTTITGQCLMSNSLDLESLLLEMTIIHNKGLIFQAKGQTLEAVQMYEFVAQASQWVFPRLGGVDASTVQKNSDANNIPLTVAMLAMRSCNNIGAVHYASNNTYQAECYFTVATQFARHLVGYSADHAADYATTLSNLCRVQWKTNNAATLLQSLETVLAIRKSSLGTEHPDTAASLFNLAAGLYARGHHQDQRQQAINHLEDYLALATSSSSSLDAVPALILLLLIRNEQGTSQLSRELVRGLRTLQENRSKLSLGGTTASGIAEVASVLNFVGTMLFHQQEFEHALVFFLEELRLEDQAAARPKTTTGVLGDGQASPSVVSVTCNNIGRITQELGRFDEAVHFYKRSLEDWYGEELDLSNLNVAHAIAQTEQRITDSRGCSSNQSAIVNLYSTVWYNLGLILDKLRSYDEAMAAFEMALALRQAMVGPNHPDIACLLYNIGVLQMENKRLADASVSLSKAIVIRQAGLNGGQLSDLYLIKTLEKLSKLYQKNGDVKRALSALQQMMSLQELTTELDTLEKAEAVGIASASIAELHLTLDQLRDAEAAASTSVEKLHFVFRQATTESSSSSRVERLHLKTAKVEQLVSSLLLLSSVYHELSEPLKAQATVHQAKFISHAFQDEWADAPGRPSSLNAIYEVTSLLCQSCTAPQA